MSTLDGAEAHADWGWYWKEPFTLQNSPRYFDRGHWWKEHPKLVNRVSASYEVLRRHPETGRLLRAEVDLGPNARGVGEDRPLAYCLTCLDARAWNCLTTDERHHFEEALHTQYPGKGQNLCGAIHDVAAESLDPTLMRPTPSANPVADLAPTLRAARLGILGLEHIEAGRALIAIDLEGANLEEVGKAVVRFLKQKRWRTVRGKTDANAWLEIISEFEDRETERLANPKRFSRSEGAVRAFKKLIGGFHF